MSERSETFCIIPWVQLATTATGKYRVCCNSIPEKNLIKDKEGRYAQIDKHNPEEIWNSETYTNLRKQLINGEKPEMCQRCFREEDSGVQSARQKYNEKWVSSQEDKSELDLNIQYIDLRLGNLCNLKCRMCNPYSSSKWVDDWNQVNDSAELMPNFKLDKKETNRLKNISWPKDDKTWKNLEPILENISEIYLTGGEPFLSIEHKNLLNRLIEKNYSKNITLKYNTNLTTLPEELINKWEYFKLITLNISVDGHGKLNDYIRYPSVWSEIEKNLEIVRELPNVELGLHVTVQMYNILKLDDIFKYFKINYGFDPYFNILNHPHCLNIRVLPKRLKETVVRKLKALEEYPEIQEVVNYLKKESWEDKYFEEFKNYTKKIDEMRSESILDIVNDFSSYFEK